MAGLTGAARSGVDRFVIDKIINGAAGGAVVMQCAAARGIGVALAASTVNGVQVVAVIVCTSRIMAADAGSARAGDVAAGLVIRHVGHGLVAVAVETARGAYLVARTGPDAVLYGYARRGTGVDIAGRIMTGGTVTQMLDIDIGPGVEVRTVVIMAVLAVGGFRLVRAVTVLHVMG